MGTSIGSATVATSSGATSTALVRPYGPRGAMTGTFVTGTKETSLDVPVASGVIGSAVVGTCSGGIGVVTGVGALVAALATSSGAGGAVTGTGALTAAVATSSGMLAVVTGTGSIGSVMVGTSSGAQVSSIVGVGSIGTAVAGTSSGMLAVVTGTGRTFAGTTGAKDVSTDVVGVQDRLADSVTATDFSNATTGAQD